MSAYRSWYREKMLATIHGVPESMLRELLLFAEVLRHRAREAHPPAPAAPRTETVSVPPLDA